MREIGLRITADATAAKAALREVDQALERVGQSATQAGASLDRATSKAAPAMAELHQRTLQYSQGLKGTEADLLKVANSTQKVTTQTGLMDNGLAALGRRLVAVFAVERIVSFGTSVVNTAGKIADLSAKTGLSTTAIQKFGYAAELSGSSVDAVANAISAMSRNLIGSNGGAVDALNRLGLSQKTLMAMDPEAAFLAITDAIKSIKNPMEQADLTMRVFGKSGKEILPAIKAGFSDAGDEAARLGAVMSEETVKNLDDLGDAWSKVYAVMTGRAAGLLALLVRIGSELGSIASKAPDWLTRGAGALSNATNIPGLATMMLGEAGTQLNWFNWQRGQTPGPTDGSDVTRGFGRTGNGYQVAGLDDLLQLTKDFDAANRNLGESHSRVTQRKVTDTKATEDLTAATLKYLQAQKAQIVGLGAMVPMLERVAAYRGLLSGAGTPYLQTGIAGAMQPDPYAGLNVGTHPYSMVGLQGAVTGTPGLAAGATPYNTGGGFWGRPGTQQALGAGIAGGAAMGALAGGDPYASLIGGAASSITAAAIGTSMGVAALAATTLGIGAAAVGVYLLVKHFASVSKEVKQARLEVDAFQADLWKTMTAQQVTEAGGEKWAATVIVVRDAYERMGYSAAQAESDVAKLLDTRRPDQARDAMARINDVMSDYRAILGGVNEHMGELLGQAEALGQRLPQALLDALNAAVQLGDMTEENARLIATLTQAPEVDWKKVEEAAQRYGITIDAMGQRFQQAQMSKTAQQMVDDIDLMLQGGVEMGAILYGMREEISKVVQDSLKFGTELPQNMQPWIAELMRAGLLVDAQGEALTDITNLKFGESMQTTFQRVADSIQSLIDLLKGPLTGALDTVGSKVIRPRVEVEWQDGDQRTEPVGFANGGVVYAANGWPARGTDTIPAMLTPGEGVLSRRGMAALGRLNSGDGGGSTVHVHIDASGAYFDDPRTARKVTEMVREGLIDEMKRQRTYSVVG